MTSFKYFSGPKTLSPIDLTYTGWACVDFVVDCDVVGCVGDVTFSDIVVIVTGGVGWFSSSPQFQFEKRFGASAWSR